MLWTSTWGTCLRQIKTDSTSSGMSAFKTFASYFWTKDRTGGYGCKRVMLEFCVWQTLDTEAKALLMIFYTTLTQSVCCFGHCCPVFGQPHTEHWGWRHSAGLLQESHHRWSHENVDRLGNFISIWMVSIFSQLSAWPVISLTQHRLPLFMHLWQSGHYSGKKMNKLF